MNQIILNNFQELLKQIIDQIETSTGKEQIINSYRYSNILNAINVIKKLPFEIKSSQDPNVKNIKGFGKGILARIDEILQTGKLKENKLNITKQEKIKDVLNLTQIHGIGYKLAYKLVMQYNVKDIDDLKKKYDEGKIKLPNNVIIGLNYLHKIENEIPRNVLDHVNLFLRDICTNLDINMGFQMCGSYRRMKSYSGDIDILIYNNNLITKDDVIKSNLLTKFIDKLIKQKFIVDSLTSHDTNTLYMGICKYENLYMRIDIRIISLESKYTAIMYFTGSKKFNQRMRSKAIKLGYKLNEYGLFNGNKKINIQSEDDIFNALNEEYINPEMRI